MEQHLLSEIYICRVRFVDKNFDKGLSVKSNFRESIRYITIENENDPAKGDVKVTLQLEKELQK